MIEHLDGFPPRVVAFACKGQVTRRDYETVLVPVVEAALGRNETVRLYYQTDSDFTGIDVGAMWEDLKIGIEHRLRWERIAVVTNVKWIRNAVRAFRFLISAEAKLFPLEQATAARDWISADSVHRFSGPKLGM